MSVVQDKKTRFIPTLTEVVDGTSAQMGLELTAESEAEALSFAEDEPVESISTNTIVDEGRVSVSSLFGYVPVPSVPRSLDSQHDKADANVEARGQVQIAVNLNPYTVKNESKEGSEANVKELVEGTEFAKNQSLGSIKERTSFSVNKVQNVEEAQPDGELLFEDIESEKNIFSPLSRNPAATQDSLRPSDLMLVALTDRIAAKARSRVGEKLEQHIQDKIFPLLDEFAEQLVKHIEGDLLKIMREGLAEATREELDRLRKK